MKWFDPMQDHVNFKHNFNKSTWRTLLFLYEKLNYVSSNLYNILQLSFQAATMEFSETCSSSAYPLSDLSDAGSSGSFHVVRSQTSSSARSSEIDMESVSSVYMETHSLDDMKQLSLASSPPSDHKSSGQRIVSPLTFSHLTSIVSTLLGSLSV